MKTLFEAVENNDIDKVKLLLSQGNIANALNEDNSTPLMIAVIHNNLRIAKTLLESGSDISSRDKNNNTALMLAARDGNDKLVTLLLNYGPSIEDISNALELISSIEKVSGIFKSTIMTLIKAGANLPENTAKILRSLANFEWWTPDHSSVINGDVPTVFNIDETQDITPLSLAIMCGRQDMVQSYIDANTDIDLNACIQIAHLARRQNLEGYFQGLGANLMAVDKQGMNIIMKATINGRNDVLGKLSYFDINAKCNLGCTALMVAEYYGHTGTVTTLLERGANIPKNKNTLIRTLEKASWWTPMHTAIINNELELIQRYEYIESDITPLDLAIMIANQYAVLVLIKSEIQYDINDCLRTDIVAKRNGLAIFLLEQGADPTFNDKIGRNSLHTACYYGDINGIKILVEFRRKKIAAQSIQKCFISSLFNSRKRKLSSDNECQNAKYIKIV